MHRIFGEDVIRPEEEGSRVSAGPVGARVDYYVHQHIAGPVREKDPFRLLLLTPGTKQGGDLSNTTPEPRLYPQNRESQVLWRVSIR